MSTRSARTLPIGCEVFEEGAHFRVWAPPRRKIEVVLEREGGKAFSLEAEGNGYFSGHVPAKPGALYRFRLDGDSTLYPDPASRFQPQGPHGPSEVIDASAWNWSDSSWQGTKLRGQVIYEMHIGTFTREGTWAAATEELPELARIGISVLEVMPVADFPGRFGWGYDGVNWFAPTRLYGRPDDFRRFVDRAHALGMGVILDVVYNHLGPDGNYVANFCPDYFNFERKTDWGAAINYDGKNAAGVREYVASNAAYWIRDFHLDGLRLDATQAIMDDSSVHILLDLGRAAREAAGRRPIILVAENESQHSNLVRPPERGGYGLDALWNDDYHHSALVALTGKAEAYYTDYRGSPQELISAVKWGYLFQGQRYAWQKQPRGQPTFDIDPPSFVSFLENHDQVANSGRGRRVHQMTSPGRYRALMTLTLLAPSTPLLFQGQEFAATAPFLFFADHEPRLAKDVFRGRNEFLSQFTSLASEQAQRRLADPVSQSTFEACKLELSERTAHAEAYALSCDLIQKRRADPVFSAQRSRAVDGAVLGETAFVLRFFGEEQGDRLLVVNLGKDLELPSSSEPLLAPPAGKNWEQSWSSDDVRYGGEGASSFATDGGLHIPGECALVLSPIERAPVHE